MMMNGIFQNPGTLMIMIGVMSLAPFILIMTTAFVKLSAVLSILRSALGTPQIPPNTVITGLSLILAILIMMPVLDEVRDNMVASGITLRSIGEGESFESDINTLYDCAKEPVRGFLQKHTHPGEKEMLSGIAGSDDESCLGDRESSDLLLIAAFVLSELKEAFQIGFLVFLPFIIIDMVVANILQAMGMVMLSPTTISLPFKLLLFVLSDGWHLLIEGLLSGYL